MRHVRLTLLAAATLGLWASAAPGATARKPVPLPTAKATVTDTAVALDAKDEARTLVERYLDALTGKGGAEALDALLGGATLRARTASIPDWKLVGREKHRHEVGQVEHVRTFVNTVDAGGRTALAKLGGLGAGADLQEVTAEDATRIVQSTRQAANQFAASYPVFAFIARVDKPVYWHPSNPFRKLLEDAGEQGEYQADVDLFWVESSRPGGAPRKWPLRVVRFQANGKDTGLKVLPASDWNAE